jgi:Fe-S cluster biogenesis protein NfuA
MPAPAEFQKRLQSIEALLGEIEAAADPSLRTSVQQLVQLIMDLHGAGLERVLELIRATGEGGEAIVQKLGRDELVASLLVLYGLHPMTLEERVTLALDKARQRLRTLEGEVDLLSIQDGAVRMRLQANGHGCGSTAQALKEIVEGAVYQSAPDVTALIIEGAEEKHGFVSIDTLKAGAFVPVPSNGLSVTAGEKGRL